MGLLDRFEHRLDRLVNGAFARAMKAEVQPVEIAEAIRKEMDGRAAIVSKGRTVVPNVFGVSLSAHDYDRLVVYAEPLQEELATMVREYAEEQRYTFLGGVDVVLTRNVDLETGLLQMRSEARPEVRAPVPGPAAPLAVPSARLVVQGVAHPLTRAVTRLGRGSEVDLRIDDAGVSRTHAEVVLGMPPRIRDLGSTNGTVVDGQLVSDAVLRDGSLITLGSTTIQFLAG